MKFIYIVGLVIITFIAFTFISKDKQETNITEEGSEVTQTSSENDTVAEEIDTEETTDDARSVEEKVFSVSGINYAFNETEIRVKEGDKVTINFVSDEGFHDWVVDEFNAATEKVRPGTPTSVTFTADKAGTYEYYCSVGSHRAQGMVGQLIVE